MSAVQLWKIAPGVIPTPETGSVFLFVDEGGAICCKTSGGEVARVVGAAGEKGAQGDAGPQGVPGVAGDKGEAGSVLVDALAVGAYATLLCSGSANGAAIGADIATDGVNLSLSMTVGGIAAALPLGQVWRYMGAGRIGTSSSYLFQRVL